jgi:hypothetical protein
MQILAPPLIRGKDFTGIHTRVIIIATALLLLTSRIAIRDAFALQLVTEQSCVVVQSSLHVRWNAESGQMADGGGPLALSKFRETAACLFWLA